FVGAKPTHPDLLNWLANGRTQAIIQANLARYPVKPNSQIFDDKGVLVDVLPILFTSQPSLHMLPRGMVVMPAGPPLAGGTIIYDHFDVYQCGDLQGHVSVEPK
ncbi:MAG: hypothetical protein HN341_06065, partial [Verrucomicrobia bacterium]|nr:hypothetical protein [Verrucomicrobiota bacterium]